MKKNLTGEEPIENFNWAALHLSPNDTYVGTKYGFPGLPGQSYNVTCLQVNESDREKVFETMGDPSSYHASLRIARFLLPDEAGVPTTGTVHLNTEGSTGALEEIIGPKQGPPTEVAQISEFFDTERPLRNWCETTTTLTLGEQSETSASIKDTVSGLILKSESIVATGIQTFLGVMSLNLLASVFLGLAVCLGMGKVYVFLEGRYLQALQTRKRDEIIFWFILRQYCKSFYFASVLLIALIIVWNGFHKNPLHKKVNFLECDLPNVSVTVFPDSLTILSGPVECYKIWRKESITYHQLTNAGIKYLVALQMVPLILAGLTYGAAFRYTVQTQGWRIIAKHWLTLPLVGLALGLMWISAEYNRIHFYMPRMLERVESK